MVRLDVVALAFMVKVLEQVIAGNVAAAFDQVGKPLVFEGDGVALAAFTFEAEDRHARLERHMVVLERRESEGAVVFRVFIIADANERGIEQGDDQGDDLVLGQAAPVQVLVAAFANDGQLCRERQHAVKLGLPSQLRPDRVVQVLATPLLVDPGRLQVPAGIAADPHRLPGRGDPQLLDTLEMLFGGDFFCVMINVNV